MPPVRLRQSKLSNKQAQRQRTSPARGRGRRRTQTFEPDEATTSSDIVNVSASIMSTQIEEGLQPTQQAACDPGWYGDDCNFLCHKNCLNKECNEDDGSCKICSSGWTGTYCDSPCPEGTYGKDCSSKCEGFYCKNGCNHVNGKCDNGCVPGWHTVDCSKVCPNTSYGAECKFTCGHCRDGVPCHHVTGQCMTGCEPGYIGQNCNNVCPDGHYGDKCEKTCGKDAKCNHVTGECCGCTELRMLVKEKEEKIDSEHNAVIGLSVSLSICVVLSVVFCCWHWCAARNNDHPLY